MLKLIAAVLVAAAVAGPAGAQPAQPCVCPRSTGVVTVLECRQSVPASCDLTVSVTVTPTSCTVDSIKRGTDDFCVLCVRRAGEPNARVKWALADRSGDVVYRYSQGIDIGGMPDFKKPFLSPEVTEDRLDASWRATSNVSTLAHKVTPVVLLKNGGQACSVNAPQTYIANTTP